MVVLGEEISDAFVFRIAALQHTLGITYVNGESGIRRVDGLDERSIDGVVVGQVVCRVAHCDEVEGVGEGWASNNKRGE